MEEWMMDFDSYQDFTATTAIYGGTNKTRGERIMYCLSGLCGEAGEVAEKIKKMLRQYGVVGLDPTPEEAEMIKKELGDVLWYVARLAAELNLSLSDVALSNCKKLVDRMDRGTLFGDGDNR